MKLTKNKFVIFLLSLVFCFTLFCPTTSLSIVKAETKDGYTSVMYDLTKDDSFTLSDYPTLSVEEYESKDIESMQVIQISESDDGSLFIYVYQPTDSELDLVARSISISTEFSKDGQDINPDIYNLELVSNYSVFDKYLVKNFTVSNEMYRYYNLVAIYRDYSPRIDDIADGSETDRYEKGVTVGQQWCVYYKGAEIVYEMNTFETLELKVVYSGSVEFSDGLTFGSFAGLYSSGHLWFVTFNVEDYIIKKIFDADLSYQIRSVIYDYPTLFSKEKYTYGKWSEDIKLTLKENDKGTFDGQGLFSKDYSWDKISTSSKFKSDMISQGKTLSKEVEEGLDNSQWTFAFLLTEKQIISDVQKIYSDVSKVTVLRLHFMDIHNNIYNLGVVSDRVNPDDIPDIYDTPGFDNIKLKIILGLFLIVLLIFILIGTGILPLVFKVLGFIITAPFKFLKWLIDKFRGD